MNRSLKVGVASVAKQRAWTLAIASGKRKKQESDPTIWFPSFSAVARVLSDENLAILEVLKEQHPGTIEQLAAIMGKQPPNISRSLHLMEPYGLVRLEKNGRSVTPTAQYDAVTVDVISPQMAL